MQRIWLGGNNLAGWDFSAQDLTEATFYSSNLAGSNYSGAMLRAAEFDSSNLQGGNFSGANLFDASLHSCNLTGVDLTDANVASAEFGNATGFVASQLYATASYKAKDLTGIDLAWNNLNGWDFTEQKLAESYFMHAELKGVAFRAAVLRDSQLWSSDARNADFTLADLTNANLGGTSLEGTAFQDAVIERANLSGTTSNGFTSAQLYSTASYKNKQLRGVLLGGNELENWQFGGQDLEGAQFDGANLSNASMNAANLKSSRFQSANLSNASFIGADLTYASIESAVLNGADLTDAVITGMFLRGATSNGFTEQQLYSTASYQLRDLTGVYASDNVMAGWDLSAQNLEFANFQNTDLSGSRFTNANVASVYFLKAKLENADFTGANLEKATFRESVSHGFTKDQLYSTASYQAGTLVGLDLSANNLESWDFSDQDLSGAKLDSSVLNGATLGGANLTGVSLLSAKLAAANLHGANLSDARLEKAVLAGADLADARVEGANFRQTTSGGFVKEQLYSTASYAERNLSGIDLAGNNLSGWDFRGQRLTNAKLHSSMLNGADLSGADTRGSFNWNTAGATLRNTISSNGFIFGASVDAGETLTLWDYDGDPSQGVAPLPVFARDSFQISESGSLRLVLETDDWNSAVHFQSGIDVSLSGFLQLDFAEDVAPATQVGRTIQVFDWSGVTPNGEFEIVSKYAWDSTELYTTGELTLLSTLVGDADADGIVGLDDLNVVRNHFGAVGAPGLSGDAIPYDGVVDLSDLNAVRNHFGEGARAVPEPGTLALVIWGVIGSIAVLALCR